MKNVSALLLCYTILSNYASTVNAFTTTSPMVTKSPVVSRVAQQRQQSTQLSMIEGLQEAWTAYNAALEADPLVVKSVTASVILGAADLAGQSIEKARKADEAGGESMGDDTGIDIARTVRFAFFGLVLQAPWNHFYYQFLDGVLPPTEEPFTATTGIKVLIDQFVQAPIFTVLIFAFLGFLEGKNAQSIKQQLDDDYVDTMLANCKYFGDTNEFVLKGFREKFRIPGLFFHGSLTFKFYVYVTSSSSSFYRVCLQGNCGYQLLS